MQRRESTDQKKRPIVCLRRKLGETWISEGEKDTNRWVAGHLQDMNRWIKKGRRKRMQRVEAIELKRWPSNGVLAEMKSCSPDEENRQDRQRGGRAGYRAGRNASLRPSPPARRPHLGGSSWRVADIKQDLIYVLILVVMEDTQDYIYLKTWRNALCLRI